MDTGLLLFLLMLFVVFGIAFINSRVRAFRQKLVDTYTFPKALSDKIKKSYPHLNDDQLRQVIRGLRTYFQLIILAKKRMISMPSQVVDVAWHEFILFTRQYQHFCNKALGHFLHHTPAEAMQSKTVAQEGIKRAWRLSCFRENINPRKPHRLPTLFAIDEQLQIDDGFKYTLDCSRQLSKQQTEGAGGCGGYCATHIGCSSGCSGSSGDADGGCGGGCGGD